MQPDTGNINLLYLYCVLCMSLPGTTSLGDCRNAICYLFCEIVPFFLPPLSSGGPVCEGVAAYESWQATWRRVRMLIQSGPDKCLHTHQHSVAGCPRRCQTQWCGERLREGLLLAATKSWCTQKTHARTQIRTREYAEHRRHQDA